MSSGTLVKDCYVKYVTPENVNELITDQEMLLASLRERVLTIAAMPPMCQVIDDESVTWADYVQETVGDALVELVEVAGSLRVAYEVKHSEDYEVD